MVSIFNDLGKKISQTSQEAVKKAKELAEVAKLNGSISEEEKNINKYYSQMGEKYLELYGDTTEEPFASYCESIRNSKMKIKNYEQDIKLIRNIKVCTNCGAEYSNNALFCSSCGHKQEIKDEPITEPVEVVNEEDEVINAPYESTETMELKDDSDIIDTEMVDEQIEGSEL